MTTAKAKKELVRFLSKKPFEPFRVVLDTGERFNVTRQFQLGFGFSQFGYAPPGRAPTAHRRLQQIVAVEPIDEAAAEVRGGANA